MKTRGRKLASIALGAAMTCATMMLALTIGSATATAQNLPTPPYGEQEIREAIHILGDEPFDAWWAAMPIYLRDKLMVSELQDWQSIIICNALGYQAGTDRGTTCEKSHKARKEAGASEWDEHGYVGPSEECRARNKRSKWGELICD